jgi:flagellar motor switch protein FliG
MPKANQAIRRAAILVASLDMHLADALLAQMPGEQADLVRRTIVELGDVDPGEEREAIDEFFRNGPPVNQRDFGGVELDRPPTFRPARAAAPPPRSPALPKREDEPFRFLHEADNEKLTVLLLDERPQTIALVVSHLPEDRAVAVLASLPAAIQAEVVRRWVDLEEADPEILREVGRGLQSRITSQAASDDRRTLGLARVARILAAASPKFSHQILTNLEAYDSDLAAHLGPRRLDFDDLEQFDDASLTTLLKAADPQVAVLALAGARGRLVDRVVRNLPSREAKLFRRSLDHLGPTRISDVEQAQETLARLAEKLEAEGRVSGVRGMALSLAS